MNGIELRERLEELNGINNKEGLTAIGKRINAYTLSEGNEYYASRVNGILNNTNPVNLAVIEALANSYDMSISQFMSEEEMTRSEFEALYIRLRDAFVEKIENIEKLIKRTDELNYLLFRSLRHLESRAFKSQDILKVCPTPADTLINRLWNIHGNENCEALAASLDTDADIRPFREYMQSAAGSEISRLAYMRLQSMYTKLHELCDNALTQNRANVVLAMSSIIRNFDINDDELLKEMDLSFAFDGYSVSTIFGKEDYDAFNFIDTKNVSLIRITEHASTPAEDKDAKIKCLEEEIERLRKENSENHVRINKLLDKLLG